ncbi:unnamed protein product [Prorocentrum cordatum]|uniref:Uncharacterized protein n=1 Tax=Prorocentrum cordatum TaxID=2364126 RepID=A0ABN9RH22_9DINO|nr:unnamed protein product [Polarella glacialis]
MHASDCLSGNRASAASMAPGLCWRVPCFYCSLVRFFLQLDHHVVGRRVDLVEQDFTLVSYFETTVSKPMQRDLRSLDQPDSCKPFMSLSPLKNVLYGVISARVVAWLRRPRSNFQRAAAQGSSACTALAAASLAPSAVSKQERSSVADGVALRRSATFSCQRGLACTCATRKRWAFDHLFISLVSSVGEGCEC